MAAKAKTAGKTAQNVSDNGAKFAAVFNNAKTEAEGKKILDYLVAGFTQAYNEKFGAKKTKTTKREPAKVMEVAPKGSKAKTAKKETAKAEADETLIIEEGDKKAIKKLGLEFHDYSEKAFAITGDTKPIRNICKKLGGRFNAWLTCGAGWVFPKKKEAEVRAALCIK